MLTAVVVLPTPPFWLAMVKIRWRSGRGSPLSRSGVQQAHRPFRLGADRSVDGRRVGPRVGGGGRALPCFT